MPSSSTSPSVWSIEVDCGFNVVMRRTLEYFRPRRRLSCQRLEQVVHMHMGSWHVLVAVKARPPFASIWGNGTRRGPSPSNSAGTWQSCARAIPFSVSKRRPCVTA